MVGKEGLRELLKQQEYQGIFPVPFDMTKSNPKYIFSIKFWNTNMVKTLWFF